MTDYELYVFLLCLIVFVLLTALSVVCVSIITKLSLRLIRSGADDERILREHKKNSRKKKKTKYGKFIDYAISGMVCLVFVLMLLGAMGIRCTETAKCGFLPNYRVVKTGSMETKNPKNTYLEQNNLNDQIKTFDLIKTEELPDEMDLELYDIVVYETDGMLIVHRIIEIEEPNEAHPNCRHFKLQGDAVDSPDRFPVLYGQMRAIYRGERTPFIGSFILFMQSPAGWLCTLLVVVALIAAPILDKKLATERKLRLIICLANSSEEAEEKVAAL